MNLGGVHTAPPRSWGGKGYPEIEDGIGGGYPSPVPESENQFPQLNSRRLKKNVEQKLYCAKEGEGGSKKGKGKGDHMHPTLWPLGVGRSSVEGGGGPAHTKAARINAKKKGILPEATKVQQQKTAGGRNKDRNQTEIGIQSCV